MDYVLSFDQLDRTKVALAGGKGAMLAELSRIHDISVPAGFCVTTAAYERALAPATALVERIDRLSRLALEDGTAISALSAEIRAALTTIALPGELTSAVARALAPLGERASVAVRSSATLEDSPGASFAGQHDTFLDVRGSAAVLQQVRRCWASLFSDRAVSYRQRHGMDHRDARMAVVVQRMVPTQSAGVLFTADPATGNRKVAAVAAGPGLGAALVAGHVVADSYKVRHGAVVERALAAGQQGQAGQPERQPVLADAQIMRLVRLGRTIETHFGRPQDIEWCLTGDDFQIVQSRPITTLFPIPKASDDENHVYVSVGHQQMMTDAMKPLGISFWQMTTPRPMAVAGGRLFVDVTPQLAAPASRETLVAVLGASDPLIGDALETFLARDGFIRTISAPDPAAAGSDPGGAPAGAPPAEIEADPAIVAGFVARNEESIATLRREIRTRSGLALLDFIRDDIAELKRVLFDPRSLQVILAAMQARDWLREHLQDWLGEGDAADTLAQSVAGNVTSEMGLALLDVADAVRPHEAVVALLESVEGGDADGGFLDSLPAPAGGREARDAIVAFLDRYGMRCAGEIDITRPRWSERPETLVPLILDNVRSFGPGASRRRFEQGRRQAAAKEREILARLRDQPDAERRARQVKVMVGRLRAYSGYREYPKYGMVSRYFIYKQALLAEAERLVAAGVLRDREDIFFVDFEELREIVRTQHVDADLIRARREELRSHEALTPPRVMTSDGEVISGSYRRDDVATGALAGLPVSAGMVEGRARVVLDMAQADLRAGDILVTTYTDPSWTPLFVAAAGLVTEVGGLMTHGAMIAREYGLPAVVGVEHATALIADGQQIRVDGTRGYVEILDQRDPGRAEAR